MRPGNSSSSVPNCSAMTSGEWFGSMMPPAPTRMRLRAARDVADHHGRGGAGDAGHVVVLGEPEAVVAPAFRMPGQVERVAQRLARPSRPPARGRDRGWRRGGMANLAVRNGAIPTDGCGPRPSRAPGGMAAMPLTRRRWSPARCTAWPAASYRCHLRARRANRGRRERWGTALGQGLGQGLDEVDIIIVGRRLGRLRAGRAPRRERAAPRAAAGGRRRRTAALDPGADRLRQDLLRPRVNWMYRTEPVPGPRRPRQLLAARQGGRRLQRRSTPWSIPAASRATSTTGRRWATPAGAGPTCCRLPAHGGPRARRRANGTAAAARCTSPTSPGRRIPLTHAFICGPAQRGGPALQRRLQRRGP